MCPAAGSTVHRPLTLSCSTSSTFFCFCVSTAILRLVKMASRFNALLVVVLVLLCGAEQSFVHGLTLDAATHQAAPPATNDYVGREEKIVGLDAYVTGDPTASVAVIMLSDVYGYKWPLFRKLADKVAQRGPYYVVAPDYFFGDYLTNVADVYAFLARHPPNASVEPTIKLVKFLKKGGAHSVGLAGFCWGAKVGVIVAATKGRVQAIVQNHPSFPTASDYEDVETPISVLAAPTDGIQNFTQILHERKEEHQLKEFVKIFKGVTHGWTIRYDETNHTQVEKADQAHNDMLKWFHKYL